MDGDGLDGDSLTRALATLFVNGVPSTRSIFNVNFPVPTPPFLTGTTVLTNGEFQFSFTNMVARYL